MIRPSVAPLSIEMILYARTLRETAKHVNAQQSTTLQVVPVPPA